MTDPNLSSNAPETKLANILGLNVLSCNRKYGVLKIAVMIGIALG